MGRLCADCYTPVTPCTHGPFAHLGKGWDHAAGVPQAGPCKGLLTAYDTTVNTAAANRAAVRLTLAARFPYLHATLERLVATPPADLAQVLAEVRRG